MGVPLQPEGRGCLVCAEQISAYAARGLRWI